MQTWVGHQGATSCSSTWRQVLLAEWTVGALRWTLLCSGHCRIRQFPSEGQELPLARHWRCGKCCIG